MMLRLWWARLFAPTPPAPRRSRLAVSICLETLPARDCPSSVATDEHVAPAVEAAPPAEWLPRFDDTHDEPSAGSLWGVALAAPPTSSPTASPPTTSNFVAIWPPVRLYRPSPPERPPASIPPVSTPATGAGVNAPAPAVPPATPSANVSVVPLKLAPGQRLTPDSPVFLITARPAADTPVTVSYTLAAHGAAGTTSAAGVVTLAVDTPQATVTPRAVFGGSAEVLTVVLNDAGGTLPATRSATLFVVPVQQVRDSVLVEAHREGRSAEAFAALARRYEPTITRTVLRIVGNRADAQDVSQFVFLELARTRARFPGTLSGWLRAVSRNAALAFLRAKRRRLKHEQRAAKGERAEAAPAATDESLAVALDQLPPDLGQAVRLRYLDGYTQQEAAEIVGVPRGTLSRRAAAGVQILRELLEWEPDFGEQPGGGWHSEQ